MRVSYIAFTLIGVFLLVWGILLFSGLTKWGKRNYRLGKLTLTHELVGFILFFLGIVMILLFLIPAIEPKFLSPGLAG